MQAEIGPPFQDVGCWSDHERCRERDQNRGKVKRREAYPYPCRKKVDDPASSENYLLATTCML